MQCAPLGQRVCTRSCQSVVGPHWVQGREARSCGHTGTQGVPSGELGHGMPPLLFPALSHIDFKVLLCVHTCVFTKLWTVWDQCSLSFTVGVP
mmetsp:Transcript_52772/g.94198  ORF Transcript_52772/g.94198 Transcript_52772/m.94198 type:complete len:93 (-) Transcript_52772:611-889(-)